MIRLLSRIAKRPCPSSSSLRVLRQGARPAGCRRKLSANLATVDGHIEAIKRWRDVYNSVR